MAETYTSANCWICSMHSVHSLPIIDVKMPSTQSWDWCWINHFCYWCILPPGSSICPQSCSERSSDSCHYLGDVAKYTDFSSPKWSFNVRMPMKPCLPRSCSDFKKTCGYLLYMNLWAALAILVLHFWDPALPSAIILWVCFENERFWKAKVVDLSGKKIG